MNRFLELLIKVLGKGVLAGIISLGVTLGLSGLLVLWIESVIFVSDALQNKGMPEDISIAISGIVTMSFIAGSIYAIVQELRKGEING